jgi:hypothetical protein
MARLIPNENTWVGFVPEAGDHQRSRPDCCPGDGC